MESDVPEMTRDDFKQLIKENILIPSIAKTFDATEKLAEDYLNPFIEDNRIEGFDTDFDDETNEFHIVVHFADDEDLNFKVVGSVI